MIMEVVINIFMKIIKDGGYGKILVCEYLKLSKDFKGGLNIALVILGDS
jgi:hypothetical protein